MLTSQCHSLIYILLIHFVVKNFSRTLGKFRNLMFNMRAISDLLINLKRMLRCSSRNSTFRQQLPHYLMQTLVGAYFTLIDFSGR